MTLWWWPFPNPANPPTRTSCCREARKQGALTVGITNEASSALAKLAEHVFFVRAGHEKSVAATKTYTGQVLMLYLLAYALGGKIRPDDLARLPERAHLALQLEPEITALSERYRFMDHAVVMGRGLNYATAFEFALKLMETCYVVAERFSSADFLHGPDRSGGAEFSRVRVRAVRRHLAGDPRRRGQTEAAHGGDRYHYRRQQPGRGGQAGTRLIRLPQRINELYTPIPYIIPAQIFAACLAAQKGLNPDRPRTITKVTRTL